MKKRKVGDVSQPQLADTLQKLTQRMRDERKESVTERDLRRTRERLTKKYTAVVEEASKQLARAHAQVATANKERRLATTAMRLFVRRAANKDKCPICLDAYG